MKGVCGGCQRVDEYNEKGWGGVRGGIRGGNFRSKDATHVPPLEGPQATLAALTRWGLPCLALLLGLAPGLAMVEVESVWLERSLPLSMLRTHARQN